MAGKMGPNQEQILDELRFQRVEPRKGGMTLERLCDLTGRHPSRVRSSLLGLQQRGFVVQRGVLYKITTLGRASRIPRP